LSKVFGKTGPAIDLQKQVGHFYVWQERVCLPNQRPCLFRNGVGKRHHFKYAVDDFSKGARVLDVCSRRTGFDSSKPAA
jgi:hypothetical protein